MNEHARAALPLASIRVVDLSRFLAGPYCGSILADLGAEVVRIEPVDGGEDRNLVPVGPAPGGALFLQTNRNKKALAVDIKRAEGRAILDRLIARSDVVLTNMPTGALRRMALDYATLRNLRADIITANISAFGPKGELSRRNGFDGVAQGMSGAVYLAGNGKAPRRAGCSFVDYATGMAAALGVLAAVLHRNQTGTGQDVQASLLATALTFANGWHIEEAMLGLGRKPFGNRSPNSAPSDIVRTRDGSIVVQVIGGQMFARWAELVGRPDLVDDPHLDTDPARGRHGASMSRIMSEWARQRTTAEAIETLAQHGIPAGAVYSPRQVLEDEQIAETGVFQRVAHPGLERPVPLAAPIVRFDGLDTSIRSRAPEVGEHTRQLLGELGLSPVEIDALERQGTVGGPSGGGASGSCRPE